MFWICVALGLFGLLVGVVVIRAALFHPGKMPASVTPAVQVE